MRIGGRRGPSGPELRVGVHRLHVVEILEHVEQLAHLRRGVAIDGDVVVGANGRVTLQIYPMLRVATADGAQLVFDAPTIEGRLSGNEKGWTMVIARTRGLTFTITELR